MDTALPVRSELGGQGYFEGDCTRCKKLKREQTSNLVRCTRATDGDYAQRVGFGARGYLCATCSDEVAAELGGTWQCSQCGGVAGPEHADDHWNPASARVEWRPANFNDKE